MRKYLKRTLWISGVLISLILVIVTITVLLFFFDKPLVKNISQRYLSQKTGLAIEIGRLDYSISPLHITVSSLKVLQESSIRKMEISVDRLEAQGEFKKLLHLDRPVFETVEAEGVEIRLLQKAPSEQKADSRKIIIQAAEILGYAGKFTVKNCRISASLLFGNMNMEKVNFDLGKLPAEDAFAYAFDCENADAETLDGRYSFAGRMKSAGHLTLAHRAAWNGHLDFASLRLAAPQFAESFANVKITGEGELETGNDRFSFSKLSARLDDIAEFSGRVIIDSRQDPFLELNAAVHVEDLVRALSFLKPHLPRLAQDISLQGKAALEAKYSLARSSQGVRQELESSIALDRVKFRYAWPGLHLRGVISGLLRADGSPSDLRLGADIRAQIGKISTKRFDVQDSKLSFRGQGNRQAVDVSSFAGTLKGLVLAVPGGRRISFEEARLEGSFLLDVGRKTLVLKSLEARLPPLAPLHSTARIDLNPPGSREVAVVTRGLKIAAVRELLSPFIPQNLERWDLDGVLDIAAEARDSAARTEIWDFSSDLALDEGKFNNPDFTIAGDGLAPRFHIEGQFDPREGGLTFSGRLELSQGESLWKDFYISWAQYPVQAAITAYGNRPLQRLERITSRVVFPTLGEIQASGSARLGRTLSFELQTESRLSLESLYPLFSQDVAPGEGGTKVAGTLESRAEVVREEDALSVRGRLTWRDGAIEKPGSKFALRGCEADLPFLLEIGAIKEDAREDALPDKGFLRIGELQTGLFSLPSLGIVLGGVKNAWAVDPFSLNIFGGRAEFGKTSLAFDPKTAAFSALSSVRLKDLDMSKVPLNSLQFKLSGNARAAFSRLEISPQEISAQGQAEIDIFGGKVIVSGLTVTSPFSKARAISSNIDLVDLDLKKLTDAVPFGEVTGVIRGEIRDLVFSYGQPERFDLKIESVKKKGVPQTFSLKAVDDLTVISSGQQASMGTGKFWMRYIRGFRYEKIGIVSTLRNDEFTLGGTIKEKGVEYLVKRPRFFGINVIDRDPEKKISFKEMMGRLKRVGQSGK